MADMAAFVERLGFIGARVPGTGLAGGGLAAAAAPPGASVLPFPRRDSAGSVPEAAAAAPPSRPPWLQALAQELPLRGLGPPRSPPRPCPTPRRGVGGGGAPPSFRVGGARRPRRPRPGRVR